MSHIHLIATSAFGIEALVGRQLKDLGYTEQSIENGKVTFAGDEAAICRTNLWLRCAERVLVRMGEFKALTFDQLFEETKALPWHEWLPRDAAFPVEGKSIKSTLFSVPNCQAIVKKAVVEKLKEKYRCGWFEESGPRYVIQVALLKDVATLTIDTSGRGLHKRGYRKLVGESPLKETLAAAMLEISGWNGDRALIDPFCGSGTIPIEAALIGLNLAPGLKRKFAAEQWPKIPAPLWQQGREEAQSLAQTGAALRISGSDIDDRALALARAHAREAGVLGALHLQRMPMEEIKSRYQYGLVICNPPYGKRVGQIGEVERLYRQMGEVFASLDTWSFFVLSSHPDFEALFGRRASRKRKLYNGRIQCNYYQFFGPHPQGG